MEKKKWKAGGGKFGMNLILVTGREQLKNILNCMIMQRWFIESIANCKDRGCNITGGGSKFLSAFIKHCLSDTNYATGKIGSPLDMVLFHAKGQPRFVEWSW